MKSQKRIQYAVKINASSYSVTKKNEVPVFMTSPTTK